MSWIPRAPEPKPDEAAKPKASTSKSVKAAKSQDVPVSSWSPVEPGHLFENIISMWRKDRESGRREPMHRDMVVRISHLAGLCPRRGWIEKQLESSETNVGVELVTADEAFTLMGGTAIHDFLQNAILGPSEILWGLWSCNSCKAVHTHETFDDGDGCGGDVPQPMPGYDETCMACGNAAGWGYHELTLWDKKLGINGHTDGVIRHPETGKFWMAEFKSAGTNSWRMVKHDGKPGAPFDDHVDQVQVYGSILSRHLPLEGSRILYVKRGETALLGNLAEYAVPMVDHRRRWSRPLTEYRDGMVSPTIPIRMRECLTPESSSKARFCKCRSLCFENRDQAIPPQIRPEARNEQDPVQEAGPHADGSIQTS